MSDLLGSAYSWRGRAQAMEKLPSLRYFGSLCSLRLMDDWVILAESRWKLRRAVQVMNQQLPLVAIHGLHPPHPHIQQHADKTFIGRAFLERGFDFLGIAFTARGERSPWAVSLARSTEKTSRLYEQGASQERIEMYRQNWLRSLPLVLRNPRGMSWPATYEHPETHSTASPDMPPGAPSHIPDSVLFSQNHSLLPPNLATENHKHKQQNENDNEQQQKQIRSLPRRDRWGRMRWVLSQWGYSVY